MSTPHISAEKGDFAKTVLMPGDPLRAKFIADTFLKDVRRVTGVRGMLGFTGTYEGRPISCLLYTSVIAVGKIFDIFDGEGVTEKIKTTGNTNGFDLLGHTLTVEDVKDLAYSDHIPARCV